MKVDPDLSIFELNDGIRYHLLKHFSNVSIDYIKKIEERSNYNKTVIAERISSPGSKFFSDFAKDPDELSDRVKLIINNKKVVKRINNNRTEIQYRYSITEFPEGIGFDNIISKSKLSPEQSSAICYENRKHHCVGVVKCKNIVTWDINVILAADENNKLNLVSVFPGLFAPAFPSDFKSGSAEYSASKKFWDEYVFII